MEKRYRLIRKIINLCGVVFIMLGMIPVPVLSQIGSVYAAEQLEDGAAAVDLPAFVSYTELLGSTSVKLDAVVEVIVGLPEISGVHGDWISLAILGPILADDGDDVIPTEEPAAEEEPVCEGEECAPEAEELPVEEEPVCEEGEECAPEGEEPLAEEEPVCEGEECALEGEELPVEEEPVCEEGEECVPEEAEELAAEEEVVVAEIVAAVAENEVVLVDESGEPLDMASQETVELLSEVVDPWFENAFGISAFCLEVVPGSGCTCVEPNNSCTPASNPIQAAIDAALPGDTINIKPDVSFESMIVNVYKTVVLRGVVGTDTADFDPDIVTIGTVNLSVNIFDWPYVFATIVNVVNDTAEIQDAVNIVEEDGVINVAPGTYNEHVGINKDGITITGDTGDPLVPGAAATAPVLDGTGIPAESSVGFYVNADNVTIQGFTIQNYKYGVQTEVSGNNTFGLFNNTIQYNEIGFYNENSIPGIHINFNDFNNNSDAAVYNADDHGSQFTDVTNNWWGCSAGPLVYYCDNWDKHNEVCNGTWVYLSWALSNTASSAVDVTGQVLSPTDHTYDGCQVLRGSNDKWPIHLGSPAQSYKPFKLLLEADPICGDGIVSGGEECDDGNDIDGDGCTDCVIDPYCGDGVIDAGETCDDGNTNNNDGCSSTCQVESCGDGIQQSNEECDDGNSVDNDGCSNACLLPECGDGVVEGDEECDDGNSVDNDGCSNACLLPECGDGVVEGDEECDDGNSVDNDGCSNACLLPECGDGVVEGDEECDDGNSVDNDGCSNACLLPECGDGVVEGDEECDDGNSVDNDGCSNACLLPECGDGVVQKTEACDYNASPTGAPAGSTCTTSCEILLIPPPGVLLAIDRADLITAGIGHTCALTDAEGLECWGLNDSGQVGDSSFVDKLAPVDVVGIDPTSVVGLISGIHHTCVLTSANDVYCWGLNSSGQLGDGTTDNSNVPVYVDGLEGRIISISAGAEFTCALNSAKEVFCWGNNSSGQLNDGTEDHSSIPVKTTTVSSDTVLISGGSVELQGITSDGAVQLWNSQPIIPVTGYPEEDNSFVSADRFTEGGCSMTNTGDVNCWGGITNAEVVGAVVSKMLASGTGHACTMKAEGLVCWGSNSNGQLGDDSTDDSTEEVLVVELEQGVIALAAGEKHTCVIYADETVACWGYNVSGQLGNSTTDDSMVPVNTK